MKLYTYFQSSASYRVRIALNLKALPAEMVYVNLVKSEQRSANYAAVNPQKVVPALVDDGHTLTQSLAILEYLEERYPQIPLLPRDAAGRARVRALSLLIAADIAPLGNLKIRKYLAAELQQNEAQCAQWIVHWMQDGLAAFESMLAASPAGIFCHGDTPTFADCCLMPQVFNALRWKCDLAPYPNIRRIAAQYEKHPAFIAAHPSQQADFS